MADGRFIGQFVVEVEDVFKRGEATIVHIRSGVCDLPKRGRLERTHDLGVAREEFKLGVFFGRSIIREGANRVKWVFENFVDGIKTPDVWGFSSGEIETDVVEFAVAEIFSKVAEGALGFADKELEAALCSRGEGFGSDGIFVADACDKGVKGAGFADDLAFKGFDGFGDVGVETVGGFLIGGGHGGPCFLMGVVGVVGDGSGLWREALGVAGVGEWAKEGLVSFFEIGFFGEGMQEADAGCAHLDGVFKGLRGLRPQGVCAAIPKEPTVVSGVPDGWGVAITFGDGVGGGKAVSPTFLGIMARGARKLAFGGEAFVKEEELAEVSGFGIVSVAVAWRWRGLTEGCK